MNRLFRILAWFIALLFASLAFVWWLSKPVVPDVFYQVPADASTKPGTLLRQEAFKRNVPEGAVAWRILFATTRQDGTPANASAIVMVSRRFLDQNRPIVAWAHGTTGIVPGCAPSVSDNPFANIPAFEQLLDNGWIYVATDYVGQGTQGPHPYLIGEGQARSVLDSIRATKQMVAINAENRTVVWGHSQGGHAALWTGIIAPEYAPELGILGVAAISPASDLPSLIEANHTTQVGRIMSAYVLQSYDSAYPDVDFNAYVPWQKRWLARDIAGRCLSGSKALFSIAETFAIGKSIFENVPSSGPFGARLAENIPATPLQQPLLIAQGLADDLVFPKIQAKFVHDFCAHGAIMEYRTYTGRDHVSVVAKDSPLTPDLVRWTQDRFQNIPPLTICK